MSWFTELDQFVTSLEDSAHGLFLIVYDKQFMYEIIMRQLRFEFDQRWWRLIDAPFSVRIVQYIKETLAEDPPKAVIIRLDQGIQETELIALNLIREQLFDLSTNIIFLAHIQTYHQLLTQAHDLVTWINLPYHFTLPEAGIPDLPSPPVTASVNVTTQIEYYREQVLVALEKRNRDRIFQVLLAPIADLYLDAGMYETAINIYQALIQTNDREVARYQHKLHIAEGWAMLANLNKGVISLAERNQLQDLLDDGIFSVRYNEDVLTVVDETGRDRPISSELAMRLGIVSEAIQAQVSDIKNQTTDPTLLFFDAEQAHTYWARRYGIGYNLQQIRWDIAQNGAATVARVIEIEAYAALDDLDTYLSIPEKASDDTERSVDFEDIKSLSSDRRITLEEKKIESELRRLSAKIVFSPRLGDGERATYKMTERLSPIYAVNVSEAELNQREKSYDYAGWNINRPTRRLTMRVDFPEGARPTAYNAEVRYASTSGFPSDRLHYEEHRRLQEPTLERDHDGRYALQLEVNYPMIGLIYILRWQPVATNTL